MDTINFQPLIKFLKEIWFEEIYSDEKKVELKKEDMSKIGILIIPRQTSNKLVFNWTFNTIFNILIENNLAQEYELKILEKNMLNNQNIISIRFFSNFKLKLEETYKTMKSFFDSYRNFLNIENKWDIASEIDYFLPSKWSFILNFWLPKVENGLLMEENNLNKIFTQTINNLLTWNEDKILDLIEPSKLKPFIKELHSFAKTVIWKAEIYNANKNWLSVIIEKVWQTKRNEIIESLKKIEHDLEDEINIPKKIFVIKWISWTIKDKTKQAILETELEWKEVIFKRSFSDNNILKKISELYLNNDLQLKNIKYIRLKDYYRILNAEI